ncbi:MAG TPA: hypothetical protein VGN20_14280 [Mucilaginibacter sp.]|jgi:hypothetical protein
MEDELNIDPRETDYADDYDMNAAMNFFELEKQFAKLGYESPEITARLRDVVRFDNHSYRIQHREKEGQLTRDYFFELYREKPNENIKLHHYEASVLDRETLNMFYRGFDPTIPKSQADQVLNKQRQLNQENGNPYNLDQAGVDTYLNNTNNPLNTQQIMNTENLSYLQKQLLNLGFGEKMNEELEKKIKGKEKEFTLQTSQEYNRQNVDYTLHYKAGDKDEMYFFNKYDASMNDTKQTFYLNKGSGITAKEAYNLMDGRSVYKQLENLEGEKYHAWLVLDKEHKTENGNHKLKPFTDGWNFKPERAVDSMAIVGIGEEGARDKLLKSLEKGNRHQVTALKDGKEVKLFLEANPADHRVNLTNYKGEPQKLEHYKKPELKAEKKPEQTQEQTKKKSRGAKQHV